MFYRDSRKEFHVLLTAGLLATCLCSFILMVVLGSVVYTFLISYYRLQEVATSHRRTSLPFLPTESLPLPTFNLHTRHNPPKALGQFWFKRPALFQSGGNNEKIPSVFTHVVCISDALHPLVRTPISSGVIFQLLKGLSGTFPADDTFFWILCVWNLLHV